MATASDMSQSDKPTHTDSLSFLPTLKEKPRNKKGINFSIGNFTKEPFVRQSLWKTGNLFDQAWIIKG